MADVAAGTPGDSHPAVTGEAGVQYAARREAHHDHVVAAAVVALADHHDPAVGQDGQAPTLVVARPDGHRGHPVTREGRVEHPGRRQADHGHVLGGRATAGDVGRSGHHHLPIGLDGHRPGQVVAGADGHRGHPVTREGRVEHPGRRQADHGHIIVRPVVAAAGHDDVAVGGHGHCVAVVGARSDGHQDPTVAREGGVQGPGRGEAGHRHVEVRPVAPVPRQHDPPTGVQGQFSNYVISKSKMDRRNAVRGKCWVQLPSARKSHNRHVRVGATKPRHAADDDLPVVLEGNRISKIVTSTDINGLDPIIREAGIQGTIGGVPSDKEHIGPCH